MMEQGRADCRGERGGEPFRESGVLISTRRPNRSGRAESRASLELLAKFCGRPRIGFAASPGTNDCADDARPHAPLGALVRATTPAREGYFRRYF